MAFAATAYQHLVLDAQGVPVVQGANTKVVEVVLHARSSGLTPEQLAEELPHLSPAQIHSALAYYWDHKEALDADIEARREFAERMRREMGQPAFAERLARERGRGLRAAGEIEPATGSLEDLPEPLELAPGVEPPSEVLARLRRDER